MKLQFQIYFSTMKDENVEISKFMITVPILYFLKGTMKIDGDFCLTDLLYGNLLPDLGQILQGDPIYLSIIYCVLFMI